MNENQIREQICKFGKTLFDRGLTYGSSGNLSVRTDDGYLMTPTNSCLGDLDPSKLSKLDFSAKHISGDPPTKEYPLHTAFYEEQSDVNAVVHLHSTYCTAFSCLEHADEQLALPPYTPYFIMRIGTLKLIPYFMPGSQELANAVRKAAKDNKAILMANHGPVVAGQSLDKAVYVMEELEETAKLFFILKDYPVKELTSTQIAELQNKYGS